MKNEDLTIKIDDKITKLRIYKKVVKFGNGAIVYIPKDLIGKLVKIEFGFEDNERREKCKLKD